MRESIRKKRKGCWLEGRQEGRERLETVEESEREEVRQKGSGRKGKVGR